MKTSPDSPVAPLAPVCCVTIDCDTLHSHHSVWGIAPPAPADAVHFFCQSLESAVIWLEKHNIPCTFFFSTGILSEAEAAWISRVHGSGHEAGNHTFNHPYNLGRLPDAEIATEILKNHFVLTRLAEEPVGFRSPGYHLSPAVLRQLEKCNYTYSSSQLTGWVYPLLKILMMAKLRLSGKQPVSVIHPPTDLLTPGRPYHPEPSRPFLRGNSKVLEIPISSPFWGLPSVGPLIHAFPHPALFRVPADTPWIINLHLTDFTPPDIAPVLHRADPMLKTPFDKRMANLDALLDAARQQHRSFLRMKDLADLKSCHRGKNR